VAQPTLPPDASRSSVQRHFRRPGEELPASVHDIWCRSGPERAWRKDEADFCAALPVLTPFQREWLHHALTLAYGEHPWRTRLQAA
jgi:hypothetical protein